MSKRKLTRQQAWRIEKIQKERLDRASRHKVQVEDLLESGALGQEQAGRIVARFGKQVEVVAVDGLGQPIAEPVRCHLRANLSSLVTGDQVVFQTTDDAGIVTACEPRRNVLERPDSRGVIKGNGGQYRPTGHRHRIGTGTATRASRPIFGGHRSRWDSAINCDE